MKEAYLHHLWYNTQFDLRELCTTDGEKVRIYSVGTPNFDAGPDFSNARIEIGGITWAGPVEIHVRASEWMQHRHQDDAAYQHVILHVVEESDCAIYRKSGQAIPCLELKGRHKLKDPQPQPTAAPQLSFLMPCQSRLGHINKEELSAWWRELFLQRLERKAQALQGLLSQHQYHWEAVAVRLLMQYFGMSVNQAAFEQLAHATPFHLLQKCRTNSLQLEALLFGQAGLLGVSGASDHLAQLIGSHRLLQRLHAIQPMSATAWKFSRMRPSNFPTLRIAQLAALLHQHQRLFPALMAIDSYMDAKAIFNVMLPRFWEHHYHFNKSSKASHKTIGPMMVQHLVINVILPLQCLYRLHKGISQASDAACTLAASLPPEKNKITRHWEQLGIGIPDALTSQALLTLSRQYCARHQCLQCKIGKDLLGGNGQ